MRTPRALLIQGTSNGDDEQLLAVARRQGPSRRWWWGIRRWADSHLPADIEASADPDEMAAETVWKTGAWCYLCNAPIATWSSRWQVTETARLAVLAHRIEHIQGRLDMPPQEITA